MSTCLSTILLFLMTSTLFSQNVYEPTVVILSPNNTLVHKELKKYVDSLNSSIKDELKKVDWKERERFLAKEFKEGNLKM